MLGWSYPLKPKCTIDQKEICRSPQEVIASFAYGKKLSCSLEAKFSVVLEHDPVLFTLREHYLKLPITLCKETLLPIEGGAGQHSSIKVFGMHSGEISLSDFTLNL